MTALAHVEFHGHRRPGRCASRDRARLLAQRHRRAALGRRRPNLPPGRAGRRPAVPLRRGGRGPQRLLQSEQHPPPRRLSLRLRHGRALPARSAAGPACCAGRWAADRRDWRAWDGRGFTVRFADPYREDVADPAAPRLRAGRGNRQHHVERRRAPPARYLAVTAAARARPDAAERSGIYWTISPDLVSLEPSRRCSGQAPLLWRRDCAAPAAYAYPSLLDGDSPSRELRDGRRRASGSTSSRCRSDPAAASGPSAT